MDAADLRPDCGRCAALCCVALAFDRSADFAFDKPAGAPCPNLDGRLLCRIHDALAQRGFGGCARFDCLGAGQRTVQALFGGRTWLDDPDILPAMSRCFSALLRVHGLVLLLTEAAKAPLSPPERADLEGLLARLDPPDGWSIAALEALDTGALDARARAFLRTLRPRFGRAAAD